MKKFMEKYDILISAAMIGLLAVIFAWFGSAYVINPIIDSGREFYIPVRMLGGEVLYKDIFNIYGALSYQINALAYMIFGVHLRALTIFGVLNFGLIVSTVVFIIGEFLKIDKTKEKFCYENLGILFFAFTLIAVSFINFSIFNFIAPYAFAMTYGLSAFLLSVLFLIKFSKNERLLHSSLACLFAGCAVACKYEFLAYFIFVIAYLLFRKNNFKNIIVNALSLLIIPTISYGILFLQGMSISDLVNTSHVLKAMANTESLKFLYSNFTGTYFSWKLFCYGLLKTSMLLILGAIAFFAVKFSKKDKFLNFLVLIFTCFGMYFIGISGFALFAILHFIIYLVFFKKIFANKPLFVFMTAVLLLSLKTFFVVNIENYGIYTLPFILFSLIFFVSENSDNNEKIRNFTNVATLIFVGILVSLCFSNVIGLKNRDYISVDNPRFNNMLTFPISGIFTNKHVAKVFQESADYVKKTTEPKDRVVVLPESQFFNFVTKRPADNLYDSLTPMYFEAFGEENVIRHFEETKPEYFILNNRNTGDYGKRFICEDYAQNFCTFVYNNYDKIKTFESGGFNFKLYKRKDLK